MAKCKKLRRSKRMVCTGDLRNEIILHDRDIEAPLFNTAEHTQEYTDPLTVWASVTTVRGKEIFNGTQLIGIKTHIIWIRFLGNREITIENIVELKGNYLSILEVQNLEERDEWLELSCGIRGDKTQENTQ
ncbi:MAG: head-tail adaptor protein [Nitrosopumilus sp.]